MDDRYLLIGLGNPGRKHSEDRHNVGFMLLDRLADEHGLAFGRVQHQALVASGRIVGRAVVLAKPQTFMNASGRAVSQLARFYKIPLDRLLVVFDDLDLPLGTLRFREGGGTGGHKGMRSVVELVAGREFPRLRLGIDRPPGQMDPAKYVLRSFGSDEVCLRDLMLAEAVSGIHTFLVDGIVLAMSRHNGRVDGGGGPLPDLP